MGNARPAFDHESIRTEIREDHLDLAAVYADRDEKAKARAQYQLVLQLKPSEYDDKFYRQQAERALKELS